MLADLKEIASRSEEYQLADFRRAAATLLSRQFIYGDTPRDRRSFQIVASHLEYFSNLFDALGWRLHIDRDFAFAGLLPEPGEAALQLKKDEVLILLCLRLIYEEEMEAFNTDNGSVWVDSNGVMARFDTLLKVERPRFTRLVEIYALLARHGVVERRDDEGDDRNLRLRIRPAIRLVLPERYLARLDMFLAEGELSQEQEEENLEAAQ
jgi:hypothetical protein